MTILHIDSSINGDNSASREVSGSIVNQLKGALWGEKIIYRDLAANPLPHLTLEAFADTIVIGAPMYNFTLPTQLKAWIDRIVIAGKTFQYGANGPEGLAKGKRVIIAIARGGIYSEGAPAVALEHVETYLRGVFNLIGIEPEFVVAEGVNLSPEHRVAAIEQAIGETFRLAA